MDSPLRKMILCPQVSEIHIFGPKLNSWTSTVHENNLKITKYRDNKSSCWNYVDLYYFATAEVIVPFPKEYLKLICFFYNSITYVLLFLNLVARNLAQQSEGWMDGWFGFYGPFNIIGHIKPGCQQTEISEMDEMPFQHKPRPRADSNLGLLVHKSSILTTGPCWPPTLQSESQFRI